MEYIAATIGAKTFYIEKSRTVAIVDLPQIYEVPEADTEIAGISVYDGKLVVHFREVTACNAGCGIIVNGDDWKLYGMTAENIGVKEMDPDVLSPVLPGVWVVSDD
ncbi:MAG: hypothetical protein Q4D16_17065 [Eubacteriales bacterium]|nr:hypothetical protein [Eubacteriales bacterium]